MAEDLPTSEETLVEAPLGLRERQKQQTIGLIIDAFSDLTLTCPHFTMQELADAAGISVRTLYRYFPNREELITGLLDLIIQRLGAEHVNAIGLMEPGSEAMVRRSFDVFGEHDKLVRAVVRSRLTGLLTDPGHDVRTEQIVAGIDRVISDQSDAVKRQLASLVRLIGGSMAWMTLTDSGIELSNEEAGAAAAWALRVLTTAAHDAGDLLE